MAGLEGSSAGGAPRLGSMFGKYRIESVVGRGGMGVVVRARDTELDRPVALKFIAPELLGDPGAGDRFLREARLAAAIEHPHIVPVYEVGRADGTLFLAMRAIGGPDLGRILRQEAPLGVERTLALAGQIADALDAAHAQGLIHRDVKPGNVLVERRGPAEAEWSWLTDFGLTRRLDGTGSPMTGGLQGTIDYLAPELITGAPIGPWTDQYALACLVVHCLTGSPPFEGPTEAAVLHGHVTGDPASVVSRLPDPRLGPTLVRALAKDGAARFPDCRGLVAALSATQGPGSVVPVAPSPSADAPTTRTPATGTPSMGTPSPEGPPRRNGGALIAALMTASVGLAVVAVLAAPGHVIAPTSSSEPSARSSAVPSLPAAVLGGPDGVIVYAGGPDNGRTDIWAVNPDGTGARRLFSHGGNDRFPDVTPDGRHVVFSSGVPGARDLWIAAPDGSGMRQLTTGPSDDYDAAISPDGRWLVWVSGRIDHHDLWLMPATVDGFDVTKAENLTGIAGVDGNHDDISPAWAPDGSRILFSSNRVVSADIWSLDPRHPDRTQAMTRDRTLISDTFPTVDAAGRVVFVRHDNVTQGNHELWSVERPLGPLTPIAQLREEVTAPDLAPDGTRLVAAVGEMTGAQRATASRLVVMDADGRNPRDLPSDLVLATDPVWVSQLVLEPTSTSSPAPSGP